MTKNIYRLLEDYMITSMQDSAHDKEHVYRVLYQAVEIAKHEEGVDYDVLICASLLHDIGRIEQIENPSMCHAKVGAKKAYMFLVKNGFDEMYADKVKSCIETHRFRKENPPQSLEAKILFDADKLDVTGAIGVARTLLYKGEVGDTLYCLDAEGKVLEGNEKNNASFFHEYKYKLEGIYDRFYTKKGKQLAAVRKQAAENFYNNILKEVQMIHREYKKELEELLDVE